MTLPAEKSTSLVIQQISDDLGHLMRKHSDRERFSQGPARVALLYSGGIESCLLLHMLEPWRSQVTAHTVRTGAEFKHMIEFIDRKLSSWDHHIVRSDLVGSFREMGIPASVLPVEHTQGVAGVMNIAERAPRIAPWPMCCTVNRALPGYQAIGADGLRDVIHGQRAGDWTSGEPKPPSWNDVTKGILLSFHAPLWNVSRAEVFAAVESLGVELPGHYGEYASSLDCAVCPASLTAARRAWMSRNDPEALAVAEGLHAQVRAAVLASLEGDNTHNGYTVQ